MNDDVVKFQEKFYNSCGYGNSIRDTRVKAVMIPDVKGKLLDISRSDRKLLKFRQIFQSHSLSIRILFPFLPLLPS